MNDLLLPTIPAENVLSDRFRVHAVIGDSMEPTLRSDRDYVLVAPVTSYEGEGIYLLDVGLGIELFRVSCTFDGEGGLRLSRENPRYQSYEIGRERFEEMVVGIVVADIKTRDERFLRNVYQEEICI